MSKMSKQFYVPLYGTVDPDTGEVSISLDADEEFPVDWVWDPEDATWGGFPRDPQDLADREEIVTL